MQDPDFDPIADLKSSMDPIKIGARLKAVREANNLRPSEIADLIGVERTYWSRAEKGHRHIPDDLALRLVHHFGVTFDYLYLGRISALPHQLAQRIQAQKRA
ncbi:helix-turn-helix domain-containing protein [Donghicola sp. XS_ASV15]|uniref:helix-turn-helix domain-containing protein n=1 Tax=Donghicola sp. XS_ASV15 TaxID=3241295 RepID=UPI00351701C7